jgi:hypothetical protein
VIVHDEGGSVDGIMASARADVEALIQRHAAAIEQLSRALLAARWHEMDGEKHQPSWPGRAWSARMSVGMCPDYPPGISSHGHGLRGTEYAFERRGGVVVQTADPIRFAPRPLSSDALMVALSDQSSGPHA